MKPILLVLIALSLCGTATAQGLTAGLQAGYGLSNIKLTKRPSFYPEYETGSGYSVAGNLTYMGKGWLGAAIEPGFTRKGADHPLVETRLNYLTLPVLLQISPAQVVRFGIGIELAYLLNATHTQGSKDYNRTDDYNKIDLAAAIGVDIHLHKRVDLFSRYCYGLTSIEELNFGDETGADVGESKLFNRSLIAGLRFNILTHE